MSVVVVVLLAHDLITWTQTLLLTGELARCEPKRLRYRLLHTAARLAISGRTARLRLQATWPWAWDLAAAFARLGRCPLPADHAPAVPRQPPHGPARRAPRRLPERARDNATADARRP